MASDPGATGTAVRFTTCAALSKAEAFALCDVLWQAQRHLERAAHHEVAGAMSRWIEIVEDRLATPVSPRWRFRTEPRARIRVTANSRSSATRWVWARRGRRGRDGSRSERR